MAKRKEWIYDLETFPNCFTFCAVFSDGGHIQLFEISDRKNDIEDLLSFLRKVVEHGHKMVGYNNNGFDYPVLHYIINKAKLAKQRDLPVKVTAKQIYNKAMEFINSQSFGGGFGSAVKPSEVIVPQIDLFKIHHFDNAARMTSLKMLEFNMRSDNIEDLPFDVGVKLNSEEIDVLIEYNKHDVLQTYKFYKHSIGVIEFREDLTEKYGFDCTNFNDTKIGAEYFINQLEKAVPNCCYSFVNGRRKTNQTKRDVIHVKDVIFPYIKFKRPEFNAILEWFKNQTLTETKGVFSDVLESDLGDVAQYAKMRKKRQKFKSKPTERMIEDLRKDKPAVWVEEIELKSGGVSYWWNWNIVDAMNVVIDDLEIVFGTGGVHAARQGRFKEEGSTVIESVDVASMYPNIAIANRIYPEHLGETFCDIYQSLYQERVEIKSQMKQLDKSTDEYKNLDNIQGAIKLALNGTYGNSNNKYSPFYDPQYTMAVTINGQLSLCMLADMLYEIEGMKLVMMNTDGLEFTVDEKHVPRCKEIYKEWEEITGLVLERDTYNKLYIRDVNNYIGVFNEG
jgi:hypothetical protein